MKKRISGMNASDDRKGHVMGRCHPMMKGIAAAVAFIFTLTTLGVTPETFAAPCMSVPELPREVSRILQVPLEYGQVTDTVAGDPKAPALIHIQSAHANFSAEKNIEQLLGYIEKNSSVKLMLLEGAADKLHPETFRLFPKHPDFNRKVTDKLVREGYLTGPENFLINRATRNAQRATEGKKALSVDRDTLRGFEGYGIEDLNAYKKDREAFIEVIKQERTAEKYIASLRASIDKRFSTQVSKDLLALIRQEESYGSGTVSLEGWLKVLGEAAQKHLKTDLNDAFYQDRYPYLVRYYRLRAIGSKIDREKALAEKEAFLKDLAEKKISKEIIELFQKGSAFEGATNNAQRATEERESLSVDRDTLRASSGYSPLRHAFDAAFSKLPHDFSMTAWPAWTLYAQYVILSQELEAQGLRDEIEKLKNGIYRSLASTPEEKEYLVEARNLYLLKRLFSLELTRSEYEELNFAQRSTDNGQREDSVVRCALRLPTGQAGVAPEMKSLVDTALSFYDTALVRENKMFANALAKMGETKQKHAVIVTGGFHTEGLKQLAASKACSYVQITPRIAEVTERDREIYLHSILGTRDPGPERTKNPSEARVPGDKSRDVATSQMSRISLLMGFHSFTDVIGAAEAESLGDEVMDSINGAISGEPVELQPALRSEMRDSGFFESFILGQPGKEKDALPLLLRKLRAKDPVERREAVRLIVKVSERNTEDEAVQRMIATALVDSINKAVHREEGSYALETMEVLARLKNPPHVFEYAMKKFVPLPVSLLKSMLDPKVRIYAFASKAAVLLTRDLKYWDTARDVFAAARRWKGARDMPAAAARDMTDALILIGVELKMEKRIAPLLTDFLGLPEQDPFGTKHTASRRAAEALNAWGDRSEKALEEAAGSPERAVRDHAQKLLDQLAVVRKNAALSDTKRSEMREEHVDPQGTPRRGVDLSLLRTGGASIRLPLGGRDSLELIPLQAGEEQITTAAELLDMPGIKGQVYEIFAALSTSDDLFSHPLFQGLIFVPRFSGPLQVFDPNRRIRMAEDNGWANWRGGAINGARRSLAAVLSSHWEGRRAVRGTPDFFDDSPDAVIDYSVLSNKIRIASRSETREEKAVTQPPAEKTIEKVLLVSRDRVVPRYLVDAGFTVRIFGSGDEALSEIHRGYIPDAIVTDVALGWQGPNKFGRIWVNRALKAMSVDRLPVVFLNPRAEFEKEKRYEQATFKWAETKPLVRVLEKPFNQESLTGALTDLESEWNRSEIQRLLAEPAQRVIEEAKTLIGNPESVAAAEQLGKELAEQVDAEAAETVFDALKTPIGEFTEADAPAEAMLRKAFPFIERLDQKSRYGGKMTIWGHSKLISQKTDELMGNDQTRFYADVAGVPYQGEKLEPPVWDAYVKLGQQYFTDDENRMALRLYNLFHDIGVLIQAPSHEPIGALAVQPILDRLRVSERVRLLVLWLVGNHLNLGVMTMGERTPEYVTERLSLLPEELRPVASAIATLFQAGEVRSLFELEVNGRYLTNRKASFYIDAADPEKFAWLETHYGEVRLERFCSDGRLDVNEKKLAEAKRLIDQEMPAAQRDQFWLYLNKINKWMDYGIYIAQEMTAKGVVYIHYLMSQVALREGNTTSYFRWETPFKDAKAAAVGIEKLIEDEKLTFDDLTLDGKSQEYADGLLKKFKISVSPDKKSVHFATNYFISSAVRSEARTSGRETVLADKNVVIYAPSYFTTNGVRTYLEGLMPALAEGNPGLKIHVIVFDRVLNDKPVEDQAFSNESRILYHRIDGVESDPAAGKDILAALKAIQSEAPVDLIISHSPFHATGNAFNTFANENGIPVIQTYHGGPWKLLGTDMRENPGKNPGTVEILKNADAIAVPSRFVQSAFARDYGIENAQVVHPVANLDFWDPEKVSGATVRDLRQKHGISRDFVIFMGGRLIPSKGFDVAVRAARSLRLRNGQRVTLVIAGPLSEQNRAYQEELTQMAQGGTSPVNLVFTDSLDKEEMRHWYAACDIVVMPSLKSGPGDVAGEETFGLVSIEAQAMGKPVIVSNVGGLPETLVNGETGFVFAQGDSRALAFSLQKLKDMPGLRETVGHQAAAYIKQRFNKNNLVAAHAAFYSRFISATSPRSEAREEVVQAIEAWVKDPTPLMLTPAIQNYAWGGREFIPDLLGIPRDGKPYAEAWYGSHPKAPSRVLLGGGEVDLTELQAEAPQALLGSAYAKAHDGKVPYLLKILDAGQMLSPQVHTTRERAKAGYTRERANGEEPQDPLYKDENHKPEAHVALTDFWMLHSFRPLREIDKLFRENSAFEKLAATPEFRHHIGNILDRIREARFDEGKRREVWRDLFGYVMKPDRLTEAELKNFMTDLHSRMTQSPDRENKNKPDYWFLKALENFNLGGETWDRGLFTIFFFNILRLDPGQGTYQAAGVPHAYLEGTTMEIMANSDNVIRAGLTVKRIDIDELLEVVDYTGREPETLHLYPRDRLSTEREFLTSLRGEDVTEFALSRIEVPFKNSQRYWRSPSHSAEILVVTEGRAVLACKGRTFELSQGRSILVPAGIEYTITAPDHAVLFKAGVPPLPAPRSEVRPSLPEDYLLGPREVPLRVMAWIVGGASVLGFILGMVFTPGLVLPNGASELRHWIGRFFLGLMCGTGGFFLGVGVLLLLQFVADLAMGNYRRMFYSSIASESHRTEYGGSGEQWSNTREVQPGLVPDGAERLSNAVVGLGRLIEKSGISRKEGASLLKDWLKKVPKIQGDTIIEGATNGQVQGLDLQYTKAITVDYYPDPEVVEEKVRELAVKGDALTPEIVRNSLRSEMRDKDAIDVALEAYEEMLRDYDSYSIYQGTKRIFAGGRMIFAVGEGASDHVPADSQEVLATEGIRDCAAILSKSQDVRLTHFFQKDVDEETSVRVKKNAAEFEKDLDKAADLSVVLYEDEGWKTPLYPDLVRSFPDRKFLLIRVPGETVKNAIAMKEGVGILAGERKGLTYYAPSRATTQRLALTWDEIKDLAGDKPVTTVSFEELVQRKASQGRSELRDRSVEKGVHLGALGQYETDKNARSEVRRIEMVPEGIDPKIHEGKTVFVTGGKGYIAGAVIRDLLDAGSKVIVFDNEEINRNELPENPNIRFIKGDIRDPEALRNAMKGADAVVHLAAYIEAGVSVHKPALFFRNNVVGTTNVLDAMAANGIQSLAFASSAGVYSGKGLKGDDVLTEEVYPDPQNPYGETKLMMEKLMADYGRKGIRFGALRFFNAAGALKWNGKWHGEDHRPETHLLPLVMFAALGVMRSVSLFGWDYTETPDKTPIRDYIHIQDLANAHLRMLAHLYAGGESQIMNLGTGKGTSVKEAVETVESVAGRPVPAVQAPRREGDPPILRAGHDLATRVLGWEPLRDFLSIVKTQWTYHFAIQPPENRVVDFSKPDTSTEPSDLEEVLNAIRGNSNISDPVKFEILFRLFVDSQDRQSEFYKRSKEIMSRPGIIQEVVSQNAELLTRWDLLHEKLRSENDLKSGILTRMSDDLRSRLISLPRSEVRGGQERMLLKDLRGPPKLLAGVANAGFYVFVIAGTMLGLYFATVVGAVFGFISGLIPALALAGKAAAAEKRWKERILHYDDPRVLPVLQRLLAQTPQYVRDPRRVLSLPKEVNPEWIALSARIRELQNQYDIQPRSETRQKDPAAVEMPRSGITLLTPDERAAIEKDLTVVEDWLAVREEYQAGGRWSPVASSNALAERMKDSDNLAMIFGTWDEHTAREAAEVIKSLQRQYPKMKIKVLTSGKYGSKPGVFYDEYGDRMAEAVYYKKVLKELGVNVDYAEDQSTDTGKNIINSKKLLDEEGLKPDVVLLMQNPLLQRRAGLSFVRQYEGTPEAFDASGVRLISYAPYRQSPSGQSDEDVLADLGYALGEIKNLRDDNPENYAEKGYTISVKVPDEVKRAADALTLKLSTINARIEEAAQVVEVMQDLSLVKERLAFRWEYVRWRHNRIPGKNFIHNPVREWTRDGFLFKGIYNTVDRHAPETDMDPNPPGGQAPARPGFIFGDYPATSQVLFKVDIDGEIGRVLVAGDAQLQGESFLVLDRPTHLVMTDTEANLTLLRFHRRSGLKGYVNGWGIGKLPRLHDHLLDEMPIFGVPLKRSGFKVSGFDAQELAGYGASTIVYTGEDDEGLARVMALTAQELLKEKIPHQVFLEAGKVIFVLRGSDPATLHQVEQKHFGGRYLTGQFVGGLVAYPKAYVEAITPEKYQEIMRQVSLPSARRDAVLAALKQTTRAVRSEARELLPADVEAAVKTLLSYWNSRRAKATPSTHPKVKEYFSWKKISLRDVMFFFQRDPEGLRQFLAELLKQVTSIPANAAQGKSVLEHGDASRAINEALRKVARYALFREYEPMVQTYDLTDHLIKFPVSEAAFEASPLGPMFRQSKIDFRRVSNQILWTGDPNVRPGQWGFAQKTPEAFQTESGGMSVAAVLPNGNLGANDWFVGITDGKVYHYRGDSLGAGRTYRMLVVTRSGETKVMPLKFTKSAAEPDVHGIFNEQGEDVSGEIRYGIYGQPILADFKENLGQAAIQTDDLRHLIRFPMFVRGWDQIHPGFSDHVGELYTDPEKIKVRQALEGKPIALDLVPLTKFHITPEERDAVFAAWGYRNVTGQKTDPAALDLGDYFVDANTLHIRFFAGTHPHSFFGLTQDGQLIAGVVPGETHYAGTTLKALAEKLRDHYQAKDIFLWGNGKDSMIRFGNGMTLAPAGAYGAGFSAVVVARSELRAKEQNAALLGFDLSKVEELTEKNAKVNYGATFVMGHPLGGTAGEVLEKWQQELLDITHGKFKINASFSHATVGALARSQDQPIRGENLSSVDFDKVLQSLEAGSSYKIRFNEVKFSDGKEGNLVLVGEVEGEGLSPLQKAFSESGLPLKYKAQEPGKPVKVFVTLGQVNAKVLAELTDEEAQGLKQWVEAHAVIQESMESKIDEVRLVLYNQRTLEGMATPDVAFKLGVKSQFANGDALKSQVINGFEHHARFERLKTQEWGGILTDIDYSLTDDDRIVPAEIIREIAAKLRQGIRIGLVSSRAYEIDSRFRKFNEEGRQFAGARDMKEVVEQIRRELGSDQSPLKYLDVFPEDSTYGFNVGDPKIVYDYGVKPSLENAADRGVFEETMLGLLRPYAREKFGIDYSDEASIIFKFRSITLQLPRPRETARDTVFLETLKKRIASFFSERNIEIDLKWSGESFEIKSKDADKNLSVLKFEELLEGKSFISTDDQGQPGGNGEPLANRFGGISLDKFDAENPDVVAVSLLAGHKGAAAWLFSVRQLNFKPSRSEARTKEQNAALLGFDLPKVEELTEKNKEVHYGATFVMGHPLAGTAGTVLNQWMQELLAVTNGKFRINTAFSHALVGAMIRPQEGENLSQVDFDKVLQAIRAGSGYKIRFNEVKFSDGKEGNLILVGEVEGDSLSLLQKAFFESKVVLKRKVQEPGEPRKVSVTLGHVDADVLSDLTHEEAQGLRQWVEAHAVVQEPMESEINEIRLVLHKQRMLDGTIAPDITFRLGSPSGEFTNGSALKAKIAEVFTNSSMEMTEEESRKEGLLWEKFGSFMNKLWSRRGMVLTEMDVADLLGMFRMGKTAHRTQMRKGGGLPYFVHPLDVTRFFLEIFGPTIVDPALLLTLLKIGLLHDTREDQEDFYTPAKINIDHLVRFGVRILTKYTVKEIRGPDGQSGWSFKYHRNTNSEDIPFPRTFASEEEAKIAAEIQYLTQLVDTYKYFIGEHVPPGTFNDAFIRGIQQIKLSDRIMNLSDLMGLFETGAAASEKQINFINKTFDKTLDYFIPYFVEAGNPRSPLPSVSNPVHPEDRTRFYNHIFKILQGYADLDLARFPQAESLKVAAQRTLHRLSEDPELSQYNITGQLAEPGPGRSEARSMDREGYLKRSVLPAWFVPAAVAFEDLTLLGEEFMTMVREDPFAMWGIGLAGAVLVLVAAARVLAPVRWHVRMLGSDGARTRQRAQQTLIKMGSRAVPVLLQALDKFLKVSPIESVAFYEGILKTLGEIKDERAFGHLIRELKRGSLSAAQAVAQYPLAMSLEPLMNTLGQRNGYLREAVKAILIAWNRPEVVSSLNRSLSKAADPEFLLNAAEVLAAYRDASSVEPLRRLSSDHSDRRVRSGITRLLKSFEGRELPVDLRSSGWENGTYQGLPTRSEARWDDESGPWRGGSFDIVVDYDQQRPIGRPGKSGTDYAWMTTPLEILQGEAYAIRLIQAFQKYLRAPAGVYLPGLHSGLAVLMRDPAKPEKAQFKGLLFWDESMDATVFFHFGLEEVKLDSLADAFYETMGEDVGFGAVELTGAHLKKGEAPRSATVYLPGRSEVRKEKEELIVAAERMRAGVEDALAKLPDMEIPEATALVRDILGGITADGDRRDSYGITEALAAAVRHYVVSRPDTVSLNGFVEEVLNEAFARWRGWSRDPNNIRNLWNAAHPLRDFIRQLDSGIFGFALKEGQILIEYPGQGKRLSWEDKKKVIVPVIIRSIRESGRSEMREPVTVPIDARSVASAQNYYMTPDGLRLYFSGSQARRNRSFRERMREVMLDEGPEIEGLSMRVAKPDSRNTDTVWMDKGTPVQVPGTDLWVTVLGGAVNDSVTIRVESRFDPQGRFVSRRSEARVTSFVQSIADDRLVARAVKPYQDAFDHMVRTRQRVAKTHTHWKLAAAKLDQARSAAQEAILKKMGRRFRGVMEFLVEASELPKVSGTPALLDLGDKRRIELVRNVIVAPLLDPKTRWRYWQNAPARTFDSQEQSRLAENLWHFYVGSVTARSEARTETFIQKEFPALSLSAEVGINPMFEVGPEEDLFGDYDPQEEVFVTRVEKAVREKLDGLRGTEYGKKALPGLDPHLFSVMQYAGRIYERRYGKKAPAALRLAGLLHDIDRAFPDREIKKKDYERVLGKAHYYDRYKKAHSMASARIALELLDAAGAPESLTRRVYRVIVNHEAGGQEDSDIIRDSDSVSYFEDENIEVVLSQTEAGLRDPRGLEGAPRKTGFMYFRSSAEAKELIEEIMAARAKRQSPDRLDAKTVELFNRVKTDVALRDEVLNSKEEANYRHYVLFTHTATGRFFMLGISEGSNALKTAEISREIRSGLEALGPGFPADEELVEIFDRSVEVLGRSPEEGSITDKRSEVRKDAVEPLPSERETPSLASWLGEGASVRGVIETARQVTDRIVAVAVAKAKAYLAMARDFFRD
ncbi:MAG: UDP-glucose 4-epimerase GalE, partial [Candidatus Omnitrophica bacterium]|nr:UDP-glucose 4-epimerase GalE [Candidatus Omnitrophota bacterium]